MIIFNQQAYPKNYLGKTKYTIARWGCLTVCVTMIYDYLFNKQTTPDTMAQKLEYNINGNLLWYSLKNIGLKLVTRVRYFNKSIIDAAVKNPNQFIALEVNSCHWVWVIGRYIPVLGYRIVDPLRGDKAYSSRYRSITGFAIISKQ